MKELKDHILCICGIHTVTLGVSMRPASEQSGVKAGRRCSFPWHSTATVQTAESKLTRPSSWIQAKDLIAFKLETKIRWCRGSMTVTLHCIFATADPRSSRVFAAGFLAFLYVPDGVFTSSCSSTRSTKMGTAPVLRPGGLKLSRGVSCMGTSCNSSEGR